MKFNIKSKKGFTLIELLVVIGTLAVLVAIAIPSVAGLIDRANVSADNTNANEMTNAMERFVSEYELYRQDIASGRIIDSDNDGIPENMDATQSRVFNVTGAKSMEDIKKLESSIGLNGIFIDIDSKYAKNLKTIKKVVENYTKTSSSTFEPKQSDMTYWYHTTTGYTIVAEKDANLEMLNSKLPQDISTNFTGVWIDLSMSTGIPDITYDGADYMTYGKTYEGIAFYFNIPNPKYYDFNFSQFYYIKSENNDSELTFETADTISCVADTITDTAIENLKNSNEPHFPISHFHWFRTYENKKDVSVKFRLVYQYEENGETKYLYFDEIKTTCNQLINQGNIVNS